MSEEGSEAINKWTGWGKDRYEWRRFTM